MLLSAITICLFIVTLNSAPLSYSDVCSEQSIFTRLNLLNQEQSSYIRNLEIHIEKFQKLITEDNWNLTLGDFLTCTNNNGFYNQNEVDILILSNNNLADIILNHLSKMLNIDILYVYIII